MLSPYLRDVPMAHRFCLPYNCWLSWRTALGFRWTKQHQEWRMLFPGPREWELCNWCGGNSPYDAVQCLEGHFAFYTFNSKPSILRYRWLKALYMLKYAYILRSTWGLRNSKWRLFLLAHIQQSETICSNILGSIYMGDLGLGLCHNEWEGIIWQVSRLCADWTDIVLWRAVNPQLG